jgi:hypothetical protein
MFLNPDGIAYRGLSSLTKAALSVTVVNDLPWQERGGSLAHASLQHTESTEVCPANWTARSRAIKQH